MGWGEGGGVGLWCTPSDGTRKLAAVTERSLTFLFLPPPSSVFEAALPSVHADLDKNVHVCPKRELESCPPRRPQQALTQRGHAQPPNPSR